MKQNVKQNKVHDEQIIVGKLWQEMFKGGLGGCGRLGLPYDGGGDACRLA